MPFNSKTGREAGKKSKRTRDKQLSEIRGFITDFTEDNKEKLIDAFNRIHKTSPSKYIEYYLKLLAYNIPRADNSINEIERNENIAINFRENRPEWLTTKPKVEE